MKHRTLDEITKVAQIEPQDRDGARALRRLRLERFAQLLDQHKGQIRLLSRVEYLPRSQRLAMRQDESPLTIAYQDPELRRQGLDGDRLGQAMTFFGLSMREAHDVFCDCHYTGMITPNKVALRARSLARKKSIGEIWASARSAISGQWRRVSAAF
jgi:hypothetical protein